MANQLKNASSPYLLQHANNPVDWFPWGEEAFSKAASEDKPIFLSIGYSACHWCHVMEHESFESEAIAGVLNEKFVSIKVDREERPDIDQIYMQVVQMMTGSGGWPMSVFLSPNKRPFYAGTYWPPEPRWGRPGFKQVLEAVADAWQSKREQIDAQGAQVVEQVAKSLVEVGQTATEPKKDWIENAANWLLEHYDRVHGGFGGAPKFPHAIDLQLLIDLSAISPQSEIEQVVLGTLEKMSCGGIYDHLGGGFARYSVDDRWLVPHFEKMLYDNALMSAVFADAYRLWRKPWCLRILRETLDYVIRDMTNEQGGFHSTEDADSEGHEGKFYVWSKDEIMDVLGEEHVKLFLETYGVSAGGNFEGANILNLQKPIEELYSRSSGEFQQLARMREQLFEVRSQRIRPGLDDKVILSWNALMMIAMVKGYRATGDEKYLNAARNAYQFICNHLSDHDGKLWHSWRNGSPTTEGYLDDYTFFIEAIAHLFEVEPEPSYLRLGCTLADRVVRKFRDEGGGFYYTSDDAETLIARSKDLFDSSVPGSNAMAASALLKIGHLAGRDDLVQAARSALYACSGVMASAPQASAQALRALLLHIAPPAEWIVIDPTKEKRLAKTAAFHFNPLACLVSLNGQGPTDELAIVCPLVDGKTAMSGEPTLFVCESGACQQPLVGDEALGKLGSLPAE